MDKQIEKFLHIVLILTLVSIFLGLLWTFLLVKIFNPSTIGQITYFQKTFALFFLLPKVLVGICVAVWLSSIAGRYGENRTGWFMLGLFLGLMALIVFYVVRIHDMLEAQIHKSSAQSSGDARVTGL